MIEPLAGELFALVVYFSDGYLEIPTEVKEEVEGNQNEKRVKAHRFFSLATQLPMDLQMVLCNRAFGLETSVIRRIHYEEGFKKLAKEN